MGTFTTREIAAAIWLLLFVIWVLSRAEIRKQLWVVVRCAFAPKLLAIWVLGGVWMILAVFLLSQFHLWEEKNLKDTLIWCFSAGVIVLVHGLSQGQTRPDYQKVIRGLFKLTILLELLLGAYCFSLAVELILFFALAFTALIQGVSALKEEHKPVHRLATGVLAVLGLFMVWGAILGLVKNPSGLFNLETLKALSRPVLLTIWILPVSYFIGVKGAYELLFVPFRLGEKRSLRFSILARLLLVCHFGLRLNRILDAPSNLSGSLYGLRTVGEVRDVLGIERIKDNKTQHHKSDRAGELGD